MRVILGGCPRTVAPGSGGGTGALPRTPEYFSQEEGKFGRGGVRHRQAAGPFPAPAGMGRMAWRAAGVPPLGNRQRIFSVASPIRARISEMIQKRITICGSCQPFFSKWWWIGAIRKTRRPVRLK